MRCVVYKNKGTMAVKSLIKEKEKEKRKERERDALWHAQVYREIYCDYRMYSTVTHGLLLYFFFFFFFFSETSTN